MAYLFLSFTEHLDKAASSKSEFYNLSLNEQFNLLEKRLPLEKQAYALRSLIETCFPTGMTKRYYISCPNFLREKDQRNGSAPSYLRNVVVRPELTLSMKSYLPDNQNIILIGDIYESNKAQVLQIKGIQFIDEFMSSPNDLIVNAEACTSYTKSQSMSRAGQMVTFNVWSIDRVDMSNSLFTPNFVYDLIQNCYTVKNPEIVRKTYEDWQQYINFRKYYLDEQSKRNFKLDSAEFVDSYAVNRKDYKKNSSIYDDYILDGIEEFKKGDMVVLSSKIEDAESFPLVRLNIDRNKKEFIEAKVNKRGKLINEEERKIRSLASDNVFITSEDPNSNSKFKNRDGSIQKIQLGELLNAGYELGDRFRIVSFDISPEEHLQQLDEEYNYDIESGYKTIDSKYSKIISDELKTSVESFEKDILLKTQQQIDIKKQELDSRLDIDIKANNDSKILNEIKKQKDEISKKIKSSNKMLKDENDKEYQTRIGELINDAYKNIDIRSLYVKRNEEELNNFNKKIMSDAKIQVSSYKSNKEIELKNKYKDDIRNEKIVLKEKLDKKLKLYKEKVIDEETIIRFSLYFRLGDPNNTISDKQKSKIKECNYIVYDSRAEQAKIKRQENALNNFYSGYVKNPYLSTYLFNPESLSYVQPDYSDWTWYLDTLNEKQKEAVRKAVSSNGIFLLQGPPGTGKTQVIAETVAQMVKKGKKVLISSETHKAIDNVFERLPKIAEIVPVRLIPSNNKKNDNEYDPKYLVDNFYKNISSNMIKAVNRYKNFKQNKEEFSEKYQKLQLLKNKISKDENVLIGANRLIESLESQSKEFNSNISNLNDKRDDIRIKLDVLNRTIRHIDKNSLRPDEDVEVELIIKLREELQKLFKDDIYDNIDLGILVKNIVEIKLEEIDRELVTINPESNEILIESKIRDIREKMNLCKDEIDEVIPEKQEEYDNLRKQLISLRNQKNSLGNSNNSELKLSTIFKYNYLINNLTTVKNIIESLKEQIQEIKVKYINEVSLKITEVESQLNNVESDINGLKLEIKKLNDQIIQIQDNDQIKDIQNNKNKLETDINKFFKDFEINEPYRNIDDALSIIKNKWDELENNFARKEQENKEKIPMYEKISKYLTMDDVIEADRKEYTRDLFENANVFGITCTSNDRFSGRNVESLSDYNIDDIDIKSVGIDVVIIDEVSKSSFIDLLIPILYGKTVILVGDHRQLPPMYEFAKFRDEDYEGLDENIINKDINKKLTNLYEECFFKTLFEKLPDSYKTMLIQQYRCHEHIMNVFNHFYQRQLKLGFDGQNNTKKHNVRLISNGRTIIEPDKHIYFVDCKENETHEQDSTSMYNTGEAKVVVELIRKLNDYFKKNSSQEKLSIGVICTYGDQARKIKEVLKTEKVKTDAFKTDAEKMIVSTVDDFQGDERDIIILSTVRNPINPAKSNPGFILAYQRINVALSRARRMLIMVGNRKYLENKGVINLPDINGRGNDRNNFRVYEEIIGTIERYGKVIDDVDVLEDKEARING
jgi:hypothetical protein